MIPKLRYPAITIQRSGNGTVPTEPIAEIQRYLRQLVDDLNVALAQVDKQAAYTEQNTPGVSTSGDTSNSDALTSFNSIKSLIIKSADIVNAYYEVISNRLSGEYVAESEFGSFVEETELMLEQSSTSIEQFYTDMQSIITDIEAVEHTLVEVNAHIKTGLLFYDDTGAPVYGLEIGQRTEIDGEDVFNQFARFTADKLSFFDSNSVEVAYISDKKLYITHVEVIGSFVRGGLVDTVLPDGSVVTK